MEGWKGKQWGGKKVVGGKREIMGWKKGDGEVEKGGSSV